MLSQCSRPVPGPSTTRPCAARRCRSVRWRSSSSSRHQTLAPVVARPLLIDNYDSYSYNLYQILAEVYGVEPLVYHNDGVDVKQLQQLAAAGAFQHIVLSPGPGHPATPSDIGVCLDILRHFPDTPVLGVCLGHQALGHVHGAAVVAAPEPVHGRLSSIAHNQHPLFKGIPSGHGSGFDVVRYHSLVVAADSLPGELIPLAWTAGSHHAVEMAPVLGTPAAAAAAPSGPSTAAGSLLADSASRAAADAVSSPGKRLPSSAARTGMQLRYEQHQHQQDCGDCHEQSATSSSSSSSSSEDVPGPLVMALAHRSRPHYGVQFHPESVATKYGVQLLANFRDIAYQHAHQQLPPGLPQVMGVGPPGRCPDVIPSWPPVCSSSSSSSSRSSSNGSSSSSRAMAMPPGSDRSHESHHQPQVASTSSASKGGCGVDQDATTSSSNGVGAAVHATEQLLAPAHAVALGQLQLAWRRLPGLLNAAGSSEALFTALCGPGEDTFWLDSASKDRARFSFMGCSGGPLWCRVLYSLPAAAETAAGAAPDAGIGQQHDSATSSQRHQQVVQQQQQQHRQQGVATPGTLRVWSSDGAYQQQQQSVWDYLNQQLSRLQLAQDSWQAAAQLPFNFWGGFVGYLGYELKAECGGHLAHPSPAPDAGFFFADRLVVVDHHSGDVYLLAVSPAGSSSGSSSSSPQHQDAQQQQEAWLQEASCKAAACGGQKSWSVEAAGSSSSSRMRAGITGHRSDPVTPVTAPSPVPQPSTLPVAAAAQAAAAAASQVPVQLAHSRDQYLANVAACQEALHQGESYELCLTTALRLTQPPEPWTYYQALRRVNPAPYGAWMQFGPGGGAAAGSGLQQPVAGGHQQHQQQHLRQQQHQQQQQEEGDTGPTGQGAGCGLLQQQVEGLTICCSSPERFLRGQRGGLLEARPIKGTAPRSSDPVLDQALAAALVCNEKDRAENLMIVDLLRNDLGRVCEVGSVHVPGLIELESHATVHQLVSTVRGLRKQGVSCVDAVRAAFPGGSMTGAPKLRSMQILDYLEGQARGVYSGALGYFSINDTFDLNIVIRTAVFQGGQATVGAGGAVVVQSEPDKEFEEMQLKAASLVAAAAAAAAATATVEGGALNAPCGAVGVTSEGDKVAACAAG